VTRTARQGLREFTVTQLFEIAQHSVLEFTVTQLFINCSCGEGSVTE
jgi:hypothetical protein